MKTAIFLLFLAVHISAVPEFSLAATAGPYSGKVLDSQTGDPLADAAVLMFWIKKSPQAWTRNALRVREERGESIEIKLVYAGKDGAYAIPRVSADSNKGETFESTHIIIYARGYQAYIRTIFHDNPYSIKDADFVKRDSALSLNRIPPAFDHRKHVSMIEDALRYMASLSSGSESQKKVQFARLFEWERRRAGMVDTQSLFKDCCDGALFNPAVAHLWSEKTRTWYEESVEIESKKLQSTDPWIRLDGVDMLKRLKARKKIALIQSLLKDESDWRSKFVQQECIQAIGEMAAPDVILRGGSPGIVTSGGAAPPTTITKEKLNPAQKRLGGFDDQTKKKLAAQLIKKSSDPYLRKDIIAAFITLEAAETKPVILQSLEDPNDEIRRLAVSALQALTQALARQQGAPVTIQDKSDSMAPLESLRNSLKDPSPKVRLNAVIGLGALGNEAAVGPLIEALGDKDFQVKLTAIQELGNFADENILIHLKTLFNDDSGNSRSAAVSSFRSIVLKTSQKQRRPRRIRTDLNRESDGPHRLSEGIEEVSVHPYAVGLLLNNFDDLRPEAKHAVLDALRGVEDTRFQQLLLALIKDPMSSLRRRALGLVSENFDKSIVYTLLPMLTSESDPSVRAAVIGAISEYGISEMRDACLRSLADTSPEVRIAATWCIKKNPDKKAVSDLLRNLEDNSAQLVAASLAALAACGDLRAVGPLIRIVEGTFYKEERWNAIVIQWRAMEALGALGDAKAVPALVKVRQKTDMRNAAVRALAAINDQTALSILLQDFESNDAVTRDAAKVGLCIMKRREAVLPLVRSVGVHIQRKSYAAGHREAYASGIVTCLPDYSSISMVETLIQYLEHHDRFVRVGAVLVLGAYGASMAIEPLTRIANDPKDQPLSMMAEFSILKLQGKQNDRFFELMKYIFGDAPPRRADNVRFTGGNPGF